MTQPGPIPFHALNFGDKFSNSDGDAIFMVIQPVKVNELHANAVVISGETSIADPGFVQWFREDAIVYQIEVDIKERDS